MRSRACLLAVAPALLLAVAGCGGGQKDPPRTVTTTCGVPYTFVVQARTIESGSCASLLPSVAPELTVRVGARFSVSIAHEESGRPDFPVPEPTSDAVRLVSHGASTATYVARGIGHATLVARHTRFCVKDDPHLGACPTLEVYVIRSPAPL